MNQEEDQVIQIVKKNTVVYQDFPKPGIKFYDIFSVVQKPQILKKLIEFFAAKLVNVEYDKIFMLESRGFLLGVPLSLRVNKPSYPCRKKGKLPGDVIAYTYDLEYGTDSIEIQKHTVNPGDKIVIVDDLLATGGTANAAIKLIQQQGGIVEAFLVVNIIKDLKGIQRLSISKEKVIYAYEV